MKSYILSSVLLLCFIILSEGSPNPNSLSSFRERYNPRKCRDCICGIKKANRIVGGEHADKRDFPWLVQLKNRGYKFCGGSLITRRHVLTAAHCIHNKPTSHITVDFGDGEHVLRSIREHRAYNPQTFDNDIAILELYMPVKLSSKIRTICLPERNANFDGKIGISTGWGARFEGERGNTELRTVELPILNKSQCSKSYYAPGRFTDNMFCAGYLTGGKDSCQGDSGGPLEVHVNGGSTVLAGIVSWGAGCARYGYPGLYTKVSNYIDWIETYTYNECLCPSVGTQIFV